MTQTAAPLVTIAMPAFNEEHYIEACIASVQAQDYPHDRIEILIADGRSTDRTREILAKLAETDPRIRVIDNPERIQAPGLNRNLRRAGRFGVVGGAHSRLRSRCPVRRG